MALGLYQGGVRGALAAWVGFTLPSAIILILFALGIANYGEVISAAALHGLKVIAVAVVLQAIWGMAQTACADKRRMSLMAIAACVTLQAQSPWIQVVIATAGIVGVFLLDAELKTEHDLFPLRIHRIEGVFWLALFFCLLFGLPFLAHTFPHQMLSLIDSFFRAGALVFGGGHVVLPLLQAELVPSGWIDNETFLAGYGAAQAVPGPLFALAAFLGASMKVPPTGWIGGILSLVAIFVPSFLIIVGVFPFWEQLRLNRRARAALAGINAAVVGLLVAAFYTPVWTSAVHAPEDFALVLTALVALMVWKLPSWSVVVGGGVAAWALSKS
jgi:chromate transporter